MTSALLRLRDAFRDQCARLDELEDEARLRETIVEANDLLDGLEGGMTHDAWSVRCAPRHWLDQIVETGNDARLGIARSINMGHFHGRGALEAFLACADFPAIRKLSFMSLPGFKSTWLDLFGTPRAIKGIHALDFYGVKVGAVGLKRVRKAKIDKLTWLSLRQPFNDRDGVGPKGIGLLFEDKAFEWLEHLDLRYNRAGEEGAQIIAAGSRRKLHHLDLSNNRLGAEDLTLISHAQGYPTLEVFDGSNNAFPDQPGPLFEQLKELRLRWMKMGPEDVGRLVALEMPSLRRLALSNNDIGDEGARAIAEACPQVDFLDLSSTGFGPEGVRAIAGSQNLRSVTTLRFKSNWRAEKGLEAWLEAPIFEDLEDLSLWGCSLDDRFIAKLAEAEALSSLKALDLGANKLTDVGLAALAGSKHLTGLQRLDLGQNKITDEGLRTICQASFAGSLKHLSHLLIDVSDDTRRLLSEACPNLTLA